MADSTPSRWDDILEIFASPSKVFGRRSDGKFGFALIVLWVAMIVVFFATKTAMDPIFTAEFERSMASRPGMTPEQLEGARRVAPMFFMIFAIAATPIIGFILGAFVWLSARIVGGRVSYTQGVTIAVFSEFPRIAGTIAGAIQALLMDERQLVSRYSVNLSLARLVDIATTNPMLVALLGRVDLFTLWVTLLIGIGIKVMGRTTTGQAVAGAGLAWLLGSIPDLWGALGQMGSR